MNFRPFSTLTPEEKSERAFALLWDLSPNNPANKPPFSTTHPGPMSPEHLELLAIIYRPKDK